MADRLLLYPEKITSPSVSLIDLSGVLQHVGLISANAEFSQPNRYAPGPAFFQLISLIGCSPALNINGQSESALPEVAVELMVDTDVQLWVGANTRTPICRSCHSPVLAWRDLLSQNTNGILECSHCRQGQLGNAVSNISWGKTAALTNCFVAIEGIHPREAVPVSSLLEELSRTFRSNCLYCYLQDPISSFRV